MPLAAALSVRELGGVVAHELGHFAQGGGMRLTTLVRGINDWFARVVYGRDHWDQKLEAWSKEWDWRVAVILLLDRGFIWLSRRLLYGLMLAGHAISSSALPRSDRRPPTWRPSVTCSPPLQVSFLTSTKRIAS